MANSITITILDQDTGAALQGAAYNVKKTSDDSSAGSGTTDASGQGTVSSLATGTEYYLELSKTNYDSYTKSGQYQTRRYRFTHSAANEDHAVTLMLSPTRSRTQVQVFEGIGSASGSPQTAVSGATVVVKKTSDNSTVETLTTDNDGVAFLTDASYTGIGAIYAQISKTGYNTKTVYFGTSDLGDVISCQLTQSVSHTTYTLTGRLINADGTPVTGRLMTAKVIGPTSITTGGDVYYTNSSVNVTATTDANGEFEFTFIDGAIVQPVGWASYFGYPDNARFTMSANRELGDGSSMTV